MPAGLASQSQTAVLGQELRAWVIDFCVPTGQPISAVWDGGGGTYHLSAMRGLLFLIFYSSWFSFLYLGELIAKTNRTKTLFFAIHVSGFIFSLCLVFCVWGSLFMFVAVTCFPSWEVGAHGESPCAAHLMPIHLTKVPVVSMSP